MRERKTRNKINLHMAIGRIVLLLLFPLLMSCERDLTIQNLNSYPTRVAQGPGGAVYVSDNKAGSVFIYDSQLQMTGEIKNIEKALGVAVDSSGQIYVGSDENDSVMVFNNWGILKFVIDEGNIPKPNDIAVDPRDNVYVVDSLSARVAVYDSDGDYLQDIGQEGTGAGEFLFPIALEIYCGIAPSPNQCELYVADQGRAIIQVFDLQGNFIRSFGGRIPAFSGQWQGLFARLQSIAIDQAGRLHAVDTHLNKVQILERVSGTYIDSYGSFGKAPGQLFLPLDILINSGGQAIIANAENHRVELFTNIP